LSLFINKFFHTPVNILDRKRLFLMNIKAYAWKEPYDKQDVSPLNSIETMVGLII